MEAWRTPRITHQKKKKNNSSKDGNPVSEVIVHALFLGSNCANKAYTRGQRREKESKYGINLPLRSFTRIYVKLK